MNLYENLIEWDGKTVAHLQIIYEDFSSKRQLMDDLGEFLITNPALQVPITWLFKHHLDKKEILPKSVQQKLMEVAPSFDHWEAQLHFFQSLSHLEIPSSELNAIEAMIRKALESEKKFVRAWAFQGFFELTKYRPVLTAELLQRCEKALVKEPASVKARVRKIVKALNK